MNIHHLLISILVGLVVVSAQRSDEECPEDQVTFEMITGYVYTAPSDMLDSQPGTLMLTDCIDTCAKNSTCKALNYETGLCVLFSSSADESAGKLNSMCLDVSSW